MFFASRNAGSWPTRLRNDLLPSGLACSDLNCRQTPIVRGLTSVNQTGLMTVAGDQAITAHLERVRALYADAGLIEFVHEVVRDTWRSNRARWSPDRHFDDANTLGYQTSRNVNNRIARTIDTSNVLPNVLPETELGVVILRLAGLRLRVVKAPIGSGLLPDFENDFDWSTSVTRENAARRNSNNYYPFVSDELTFDFREDLRPKHQRQAESCRDLFLLWAAELISDRTAGWLGIPRIGDDPWMGVLDLWLDDASPYGADSTSKGAPHATTYIDEDEDEE